jgi:hypothetical protein
VADLLYPSPQDPANHGLACCTSSSHPSDQGHPAKGLCLGPLYFLLFLCFFCCVLRAFAFLTTQVSANRGRLVVFFFQKTPRIKGIPPKGSASAVVSSNPPTCFSSILPSDSWALCPGLEGADWNSLEVGFKGTVRHRIESNITADETYLRYDLASPELTSSDLAIHGPRIEPSITTEHSKRAYTRPSTVAQNFSGRTFPSNPT